MHPSTTAIITATEYTNGIFVQIHSLRFFMDLDLASIGMHAMNIIILHFWGFMHQGCRTQRLTKSLHISLYGQEIIRRLCCKM